jgi:hypothetical protein
LHEALGEGVGIGEGDGDGDGDAGGVGLGEGEGTGLGLGTGAGNEERVAKMATPPDQYIVFGKVAVKLSAAFELSSL